MLPGWGVPGCCMHRETQGDTVAVQELVASGVRMDKTILTAAISALGAGGMPHEALTVFHSMVCSHRSAKLPQTRPM